jgi:uncharacterized protein involved in outer membrane biogenesis
MRKSTPWLLLSFVLLAAVALAAYWLHGNLDRLVRQAIVEQGSDLIGARVSLEAVHIRPADGVGELHGLVIGNPPGFKSTHALKVQRVSLRLDIASLTRPVIVIHDLEVLGPDVIYEQGERRSNFDAILANIDKRSGDGGTAREPTQGGGKRFILERFSLRDARAQASATVVGSKTVSLNVPAIELRDLGRAQGGLTAAQLGQALGQALQRRLALAFAAERLMKPAADGLEKAGQAIRGLFK